MTDFYLIIPNRASGYMHKNGMLVNAEAMYAVRPSGGFLSTSTDMILWDKTVSYTHLDVYKRQVSKHIKVLQECELIKPEQSGREIYYHFNPKKIQELDDWLSKLMNIWKARFNQLDHVLSTLKKMKK